MYMLDTDICSYIIKKRPDSVEHRFKSVDPLDLCISAITQTELLYGLARMPERKSFAHLVQKFIKNISVAEWDSPAAEYYGNLRAYLEKKGKIVANMDLLIGAHALSLNATLVTNNIRHFNVIPKLRTVNWL